MPEQVCTILAQYNAVILWICPLLYCHQLPNTKWCHQPPDERRQLGIQLL